MSEQVLKPKNSRRKLACSVFRLAPAELGELLAKWHRLTDREDEVARLIADGNTNTAVAKALGISRKTLDVHRLHVKQKLGVPAIGVPRVFFAIKTAGLVR